MTLQKTHLKKPKGLIHNQIGFYKQQERMQPGPQNQQKIVYAKDIASKIKSLDHFIYIFDVKGDFKRRLFFATH